MKESKCNPDEVTELLRKHIPDIKIHTNIGSELSYILDDENSAKYQKLLEDLEQNAKRLYVESIGISQTTLEEVFHHLGSDKQEDERTETSTRSTACEFFEISPLLLLGTILSFSFDFS